MQVIIMMIAQTFFLTQLIILHPAPILKTMNDVIIYK